MPRGHSNVYLREMRKYPTNPEVVLIPIAGGAYVTSVRPLPPLVLDREDWERIGRFMGWNIAQKGGQ